MLGRVASLACKAAAAATSGPAQQPLSVLASSHAVSTLLKALGQLASHGFATNSHDIFNVHKETVENNANTTFEFLPATLTKCKEIIDHYPANYKASAVIPVLDIVQQQNNGWLSLAAMNAVAKLLEMPEIRVYEVATFYTMFNRSKMGKYHVMICGTTPCRLQGALKIQDTIEKHLGIHIGETSKDGMFTLGEMECMGACVNAPMIAVADYTTGVEGFTYNYYEDLTPDTTIAILDALKKGEKPRLGSQFRSKAEPAGCVAGGKWIASNGTQTLTGTPRGPSAPNLDKAAA